MGGVGGITEPLSIRPNGFQNIHSISVKITIRTASLPLQIRGRQAARGFLCSDVSQIALVIQHFYYSHIIWVLSHIIGFLTVVVIEVCPPLMVTTIVSTEQRNKINILIGVWLFPQN